MKPGWNDALEATWERYSMGEVELLERRKYPRTVVARQYLWMRLHDTHGWSFSEIGRYTGFGHVAVLYGVRKARQREEESNATKIGVHAAVGYQEAEDVETV